MRRGPRAGAASSSTKRRSIILRYRNCSSFVRTSIGSGSRDWTWGGLSDGTRRRLRSGPRCSLGCGTRGSLGSWTGSGLANRFGSGLSDRLARGLAHGAGARHRLHLPRARLSDLFRLRDNLRGRSDFLGGRGWWRRPLALGACCCSGGGGGGRRRRRRAIVWLGLRSGGGST